MSAGIASSPTRPLTIFVIVNVPWLYVFSTSMAPSMFVLLSAGRIIPEIIPFEITRILAFFFSLYLTFYTATVLFSTSRKERMVMGSFAIVSTVCFWITAFATLNWD